ncbi:MAG: AraC family transcriptional regulator [Anaerolinea sp.]|nr:AraC family transcriptional regulator [Anaerolinea sp.]
MTTRREFVCTAAAAVALPGLSAGASPDAKPLAEIPADKSIRVGALVFPRMDQIDLTGPFAVLSRLPNATVKLLWKSTEPVRDYRGLGLIPDAKMSDAGEVDLLVVPGGPGQEDLMEDEAVLKFIADRAAKAACVFSVCTGALVCGAAGLLKGRKATTHWASVQFLKYFGAAAVDKRVVVDGKLVSAAGLTAGIDGALQVAALLRGEVAAKAIQLDIQYAPEPPFDCGHPDKAPPEIVAKQRAAFRPLTDKRLATAKRVAAKLGIQVKD